jgi:hypothetical protein
MPTPTYTLINSSTVGSGGASAITFSSIPGTYTDLCIKYSLRNTLAANADNVAVTLNGVTAGYSERLLFGDGSTATSLNRSSRSDMSYMYQNAANSTSNTFANGEIYIPNYTSSNAKSISVDSVTENNATSANTALEAGLAANVTSAITSISLGSNNGTYVQYSSAYLYGIVKS